MKKLINEFPGWEEGWGRDNGCRKGKGERERERERPSKLSCLTQSAREKYNAKNKSHPVIKGRVSVRTPIRLIPSRLL